jgi:ferredoxin--NADP+ reductase
MVCGSTGLNTDLIEYFESIGMQQGNTKTSGEFVVEKAFVRR